MYERSWMMTIYLAHNQSIANGWGTNVDATQRCNVCGLPQITTKHFANTCIKHKRVHWQRPSTGPLKAIISH